MWYSQIRFKLVSNSLRFVSNSFRICFRFVSNSLQYLLSFWLFYKKFASVCFRNLSTPFNSFQVRFRSELIHLQKAKFRRQALSHIFLQSYYKYILAVAESLTINWYCLLLLLLLHKPSLYWLHNGYRMRNY